MPKKLNKAGELQNYIPKGNGEESGEYASNDDSIISNMSVLESKNIICNKGVNEKIEIIRGILKKEYVSDNYIEEIIKYLKGTKPNSKYHIMMNVFDFNSLIDYLNIISRYNKFANDENSQPFAPLYEVTYDMLLFDMERGIYNGSYEKNPSARNINEAINGEYIFSEDKSKHYTYVIDLDGNIIIGERNGNGFNGKATPHPTLIGGENPRVKMAGILTIENGKITSYNHMSDHYKPNIKSMEVADEAFGKLPSKLFKGGKKND